VSRLLQRVATREQAKHAEDAPLHHQEMIKHYDLVFAMAAQGWNRSLELSRQDEARSEAAAGEDPGRGARPRMAGVRVVEEARVALEGKRELLGLDGKEDRASGCRVRGRNVVAPGEGQGPAEEREPQRPTEDELPEGRDAAPLRSGPPEAGPEEPR